MQTTSTRADFFLLYLLFVVVVVVVVIISSSINYWSSIFALPHSSQRSNCPTIDEEHNPQPRVGRTDAAFLSNLYTREDAQAYSPLGAETNKTIKMASLTLTPKKTKERGGGMSLSLNSPVVKSEQSDH